MKKILISLMAIALVIGLVGAGTMAYFSDEETSSDNIFQAGVVDLKMKVNSFESGKVEFKNIAPCKDLAPVTIAFTNLGNIWAWVNMDLTFTEADDATYVGEFSGTGWEMSADEFAKLVYVKALTQDDSVVPGGPWNILPDLVLAADTNGDGLLSLYELKMGLNTTTPPDCIFTLTKKTITIVLTFHLADAFVDGSDTVYTGAMTSYSGTYKIYQGATRPVWNVPQADGITVGITVNLDQRIPQP